jgi:predicted AAA+ superfamily ATPase
MIYLKRSLETVVTRAAREFPAVVITGPRQSGKTTLLKHLFASRLRLVSLEPPDVRAAAEADPRGFLDLYPAPVVFDEVQHAPALLPYIKERIDARRDQPGQYLLTGSQNLQLAQGVTESLAGRVAVLRLLPMTERELASKAGAPLPWERKGVPRPARSRPPKQLWTRFLRGYYPEPATSPRKDASLWQAGYVQTYLERDVRSVRQVGDLSRFQAFLRLLAARSAQLLDLSGLSRDLGVAVNTVKAWLSVLEATYQVVVLRPYFSNAGKRLVKAPKVYFMDVGTLCYLAGLRDPMHAMAGPMGGAIFETAVIGEVYRTLAHRGVEPRLYFWRTATGTEVDLIVETDSGLVPVEVKLASTPNPAMAKGIEAFRRDYEDRVGKGFVIHTGAEVLPLGSSVLAWPFAAL